MLLGHCQQILDLGLRTDSDRVTHDDAFVLLDLADFRGLLGDAHALVDDADTTFLRHGDGQASFGDGIHRRGDKRDIDADVACET